MNPLVRYYVNQAGLGGYGHGSGIGSIYAVQPFVQRVHGIGNILGNLWRFVKSCLWSGAKSLEQDSLRTGGRILSDIADKSPDVSAGDIVSKHVSESTQNFVWKLRGGGHRKRKGPQIRKKEAPSRCSQTYKKGNIFINLTSSPLACCGQHVVRECRI
jgi:hypothetical protein